MFFSGFGLQIQFILSFDLISDSTDHNIIDS